MTCSDQILQRAKQLQESRIDIQLFNLTPEGQEFTMDFWASVVSESDDPLGSQSTEPLRIQVRHRPRADDFGYIISNIHLSYKYFQCTKNSYIKIYYNICILKYILDIYIYTKYHVLQPGGPEHGGQRLSSHLLTERILCPFS